MSNAADLSDAKRLLLRKMLSGAVATRGGETGQVTPRSPGTTAPLSPEQSNVWAHAAMAPDVPLYNEPITVHRKGGFDLAVMERAFNEILRRHEIWRTAFATVDGEVVQVVQPELSVRLTVTDLSGLPAPQREAEALRIATADARQPLDLGKAPLFRIRAIKLAEDDHRLHLTLHHIIFDGVTIYKILVPELSAIYAAYAAGKDHDLPEPLLQYGDYAIWRQLRIDSAALDPQMEYWRGNLSGMLPVLELPTDRPRPATPSYRGAMATFDLSGTLTQKIKTLSRKEGVTIYMTLLAAFKVLLYRYSGQRDIIVGGVTDTRRRPELQGLMGYFLNSLALRTHPSGEKTFRAFLHDTRDTVLGALSASEVPFDRIVRALRPKRDPSRHPLFQVLFSIEPPASEFSDGWDLTQMDVTIGAAKFDLYLELDERPDGVIGRFLYSTDLFDEATIARMIRHWTTILAAVVADPAATLARLPLLTGEEQQQLLVDWNATRQDHTFATLNDWFEAAARKTPDAVAVTCEGNSWTYRELDRRATRLAALLRLAAVGANTLVAISIERSLDMVAGLLAVLKAGGAYLPLDPVLPRERIKLILDDAKPQVLLTQQSLAATMPKTSARTVLCEDLADATAARIEFRADTGPENLAYVLYTSGSTGKPNGVEVTHRAVVNLLASMQQRPGFSATDSLLAVTTLSFDIATLELFLPLVSGGTVIVAERNTAADTARLAALIEQMHPTVMQATPATWRALVESGWRGRADMTILCGGDALPRELADRLLPCCSALWNMYGPTETTIWSTVEKVEPGEAPVLIGRPIANTSIYILDGDGNPVPEGATGELYIGGVGLARGYRNRVQLTAERFVAREVAPGERLYRTGDLARYRRLGAIECLGRTDNQIKLRGFRVAPEEVEAALASHPDIAAAVVNASPDASGEMSLSAYVVPRSDPAPSAAELRRFLHQLLPHYMVPARYATMAALPMTPNRKVDRNALPKLEAHAREPAHAQLVSADEFRLAGIWRELLGVSAIGPHDNFHDLGGHSLLMTKLLVRIEAEFNCCLTMTPLFNAPTLAGMAALLSGPVPAKPKPRLINIQRNGSRSPLYWLFGGPTLRPLAEALGPDQPFFGVALGPEEQSELSYSSSVGEIAGYLVRAIRSAQPSGPYFIGGWCTAGIVAYEVAHQLMENGEEVGLLVLVHATNPVHFLRIGTAALWWSKLKHHLATLWRLEGRRRRRYAMDRVAGVFDRIAERFHRPPAIAEFVALNKILDHAALRYAPKPYGGDVALFQPANRPDVLDYRPGWRDVVRGAFAAFEIAGSTARCWRSPMFGGWPRA